jgi:hypothetical protein
VREFLSAMDIILASLLRLVRVALFLKIDPGKRTCTSVLVWYECSYRKLQVRTSKSLIASYKYARLNLSIDIYRTNSTEYVPFHFFKKLLNVPCGLVGTYFCCCRFLN